MCSVQGVAGNERNGGRRGDVNNEARGEGLRKQTWPNS